MLRYDGKMLWSFDAASHDWSMAARPALGLDETLYVSATDALLALTKSGKLKWRTKAGKTGATYIVVDKRGTIYCVVDGRSVYSLTSSGKLLWTWSPAREAFLPADEPEVQLSEPAVGPAKTLYVQGGPVLFALR